MPLARFHHRVSCDIDAIAATLQHTDTPASLLAARRATMGLLAPAEGINYNFILGMYSFFLALGALFAGLEFILNVEAVKGFYLVFAPFVPAFLWCTVVRSAWLSAKAKTD
jgi:hypothetical protein